MRAGVPGRKGFLGPAYAERVAERAALVAQDEENKQPLQQPSDIYQNWNSSATILGSWDLYSGTLGTTATEMSNALLGLAAGPGVTGMSWGRHGRAFRIQGGVDTAPGVGSTVHIELYVDGAASGGVLDIADTATNGYTDIDVEFGEDAVLSLHTYYSGGAPATLDVGGILLGEIW
jgi:hypothetical protein